MVLIEAHQIVHSRFLFFRGGGGGGEDNLALIWKRGFFRLLNEVMEKFKVVQFSPRINSVYSAF